MTRAVIVNSCHNCPFLRNSQGSDDALKPYCIEAKQTIPHEVKLFGDHKVGWLSKEVPAFCPLPQVVYVQGGVALYQPEG